jgi:hypothetical protein
MNIMFNIVLIFLLEGLGRTPPVIIAREDGQTPVILESDSRRTSVFTNNHCVENKNCHM